MPFWIFVDNTIPYTKIFLMMDDVLLFEIMIDSLGIACDGWR